MAQHIRRHLEIGDHAVLDGANRRDGAGGAADHFFCFFPYGHHFFLPCAHRHSHNAGLADHDPFVLDADQGVCRAEVDSYIL